MRGCCCQVLIVISRFGQDVIKADFSRQGRGSGLVCENCGFNGHTIDRCFKIIGYLVDFEKKKSGQNFKKQSVSNNNSVGKSSSSGFTNEQMATLTSLIKDNKVRKNVHDNMAGTYFNNSSVLHKKFEKFFYSNTNFKPKLVRNGKIVDSWANQHMTYTDKELDNVLDISHLKNIVGHPNGIEVYISKIRNLRLSNGLTLYDVMVIPEYCVTLKSIHKPVKENKVIVAFDENRCCFLNQDLNLKNVLRIGEQCEGLYYYNDKDHVLNVFKDSLNIDKKDNIVCCEICQRAKQTRKTFPLSDHTSKRDVKFFENIFPFKDSEVEKNDSANAFQDVNHINFFDIKYLEISNDNERIANDMNKGKSDSSSYSVCGNNINTTDFLVDSKNDDDSSDDLVATQNEEVATLEENVFPDEDVVFMKPPEGYVPSDNKYDKGVFLALLVYMDDIIITGNSVFEIEKFKVFLKSKFMIKDLGKLKYFLGIEVVDTDKGFKQGLAVFDQRLKDEGLLLTNSPKGDISYIQMFFLTYVGGRAPLHLQEDFCGTALLSTEWLRSDSRRTSVGLDFDL
nr:ribonuclease H-like domain-containing protein [Tanacetum cinerariifolium]